MELGDDRVSQDFHDKSQKIRTILRQSGVKLPKPHLHRSSPPVKKPAVIEESAELPMEENAEELQFPVEKAEELQKKKMHPHQ